jgi:hypothetical protein
MPRSHEKPSPKRWVRRRTLDLRYDHSGRTTWRHVAAGLIPPPEYPLGPKLALWDMDKIEENERRAVKRPLDGGGVA